VLALYAAGVGVWDAEVRDGSWRPFGNPKFPLVLGTDGAGIVVAKGARVWRFNLGDRLWACDYANPKGGFYAEYVAVDSQHAGRAPKHLDLFQAGAGATTGLTALQGIDGALHVRRDETVLIYGASGAVGTLAVQFTKRRRARVIATATGMDGSALVRSLGANAVFDARSKDAVEQLRKLARGEIDAALVIASGDSLEECLNLVRPGGRVAYPNGVEPEPKRRRHIRLLAYDAVAGPSEFARLERAAGEARLRVPLAAVYPLAQAAKAHTRLERGHILGGIALPNP
jgi:NADPH:quinone reductase-like Zn-dependent oxidoreductase